MHSLPAHTRTHRCLPPDSRLPRMRSCRTHAQGGRDEASFTCAHAFTRCAGIFRLLRYLCSRLNGRDRERRRSSPPPRRSRSPSRARPRRRSSRTRRPELARRSACSATPPQMYTRCTHRLCTHTPTCTRTCRHTCAYARARTPMHMHTHVHMYMYMCMYTWTYTCTFIRKRTCACT